MNNRLSRNSFKGKFLPFAISLMCLSAGYLMLAVSGQAIASEKLSQQPTTERDSGEKLGNETQTDPTTEPTEDQIHLVIKLKARRVYVYRGKTVLTSYPIAVGKKGWETPKGEHEVINKEIDPIFISFKTGKEIGPGQENPLGPRWIGFWSDGKTQIGFHGTNQPELIGKAVSHGCVRMHNKDVIALYEKVKIGTVVKVVP